MTQQNPFAGITLHTRGYLNADHLIAHLCEIGYRKYDDFVETLVANAVFPMMELCSFSVQVENPSDNMGTQTAADEQTYSELYKRVRGASLNIPMCVALMEHFSELYDKDTFGNPGYLYLIKTKLFVDHKEMYAKYLQCYPANEVLLYRTHFTHSRDYHDVMVPKPEIPWLSATRIEKKCA
ncbi:MAG: hypothetical protein HGA67_04460 [Candidatus Yonathbacteria bacterium]|nr:hypothetical protein [Candidatus Yonathbacteria bacterium]